MQNKRHLQDYFINNQH